MICEQNFNLSQPNNLKSIRKMHQKTQNFEEPPNSKSAKAEASYEQKEYNILPLFKDQFKHLNDKLSLYSNEYLACRWNSFLDNVPESYVSILLYLDNKKLSENRVVRRKLLTGNFYGIDNKLAPIPQLSYSRTLTKERRIINHCK